MERNHRFWGCDFDPNPDIESLRRKLMKVIQNGGKSSGRGPYDIYFERLSQFGRDKQEFAGKYSCPSWLSATPDFKAEIYPESYRTFINGGGCLDYVLGFGKYVVNHTPNDAIPVCMGVDHCLTGGAYYALSKRYPDAMLVVFDRHLDAISPATRNQLVGYELEQKKTAGTKGSRRGKEQYEYHGAGFQGGYDTGSFLLELIEHQIVKPSRLMVIGIQDAPAKKIRDLKDERIIRYLREYDYLVEAGVNILSLADLRKPGFISSYQHLERVLEGKTLYLSIDVDVFDNVLGRNARYRNHPGLGEKEMEWLLDWLSFGEANLIGMDIMELDVNFQFDEEAAAIAYDHLLRYGLKDRQAISV